ncbi:hypothetical protein [Roseovarius sp.]|uniref:hypothetical protein n=1 Tax=Roseovarius sp. TaxID=1486281 RepID=UPI003567336F
MKDVIARMQTHGTASQRQDIRKAKVAFALHGFEAAGLNTFPADLTTFDQKVPKLSGTMPSLQRLIHAAGISENTYKQSWRAARRLISEYTGATADKKERGARGDEWAELQRRAAVLVEAGLVDRFVLRGLPALTDTCRLLSLAPFDLTDDTVETLLTADGAYKRKTLRKGLKALDQLRDIPRLTDLLPAAPIAPAPKPAGRLVTLPPHLQASIHAWVNHAAREKIEDARYDHLAEPLSESARYRRRAALSLWIETLPENGADLPQGTFLAELFSPDQVDFVLGRWSSAKSHAARTHYNYTIDLAALLSRHGLHDEASYVVGMTNVLGRLKEGRAAGRSMSPKVRRWCETLLRDPQKIALFDRQHLEYLRLAHETLTTAKAEGFDLRALANPEQMKALPDAERYRAKRFLKRARMFGVLAAYAAIALEGAPFRRQNILGIRHTGPKKTIFLHLSGRTPHAILKFPNEELKNGKWLTERGEQLEPVTIQRRYEEDYGPDILTFYLKEIRPLFSEADQTHCLFPPVRQAYTSESGLGTATFDIWLAEGSAKIGLPLCSHNFRHGYCSIAINEGRVSMEDLGKIMGDTVSTLRRHYAWINAAASVVAVQKDFARRRAESARARKGSAR